MRMRPVLAAGVLAVLVAGCGQGSAESTPAVAEPWDDYPPIPVAPTWVPAEEAAAVAGDALNAYASPELSYPQWWEALAPHLSDTARTAYAETDPAQVEATELLTVPRLEPTPSPWLAAVEAETDAGKYQVYLSRADDGTWQVDRIEPLDAG